MERHKEREGSREREREVKTNQTSNVTFVMPSGPLSRLPIDHAKH